MEPLLLVQTLEHVNLAENQITDLAETHKVVQGLPKLTWLALQGTNVQARL